MDPDGISARQYREDPAFTRSLFVSVTKRIFIVCILTFWNIEAAPEGKLAFTMGDKQYATENAQGILECKAEKTRILIGVKDNAQRLMLVFTIDVPVGDEKKPMSLNTHDSLFSISLQTAQGAFTAMAPIQLAKPNTTTLYLERVDIETGELEDAPLDRNTTRREHRKVRSEYRRVRPKWYDMSRADRLKQGEGVIENSAFKDTYFSLQLTPVIKNGVVSSYNGTFSGSGRFAQSHNRSERRLIRDGSLNVRIQYAP